MNEKLKQMNDNYLIIKYIKCYSIHNIEECWSQHDDRENHDRFDEGIVRYVREAICMKQGTSYEKII